MLLLIFCGLGPDRTGPMVRSGPSTSSNLVYTHRINLLSTSELTTIDATTNALECLATSSSRASRNLHREPPKFIIAGNPASRPRDIIVASLAKSSSRAPRDSHCVEFSLQTSRHLRPEPRKIIIALLLLLLLLLLSN